MTPEEFVKARKALGLDKRKMAEELGASYSAVAAWENGQNRIPLYIERFICCLLLAGDIRLTRADVERKTKGIFT